MSLNNPFPGEWYAGADRPSSPAAWRIGREIAMDALRIRSYPRAPHPRAIALLEDYDHLGYLDHYGGVEGVVEISEAAHYLTWVLESLARIFEIARRA